MSSFAKLNPRQKSDFCQSPNFTLTKIYKLKVTMQLLNNYSEFEILITLDNMQWKSSKCSHMAEMEICCYKYKCSNCCITLILECFNTLNSKKFVDIQIYGMYGN